MRTTQFTGLFALGACATAALAAAPRTAADDEVQFAEPVRMTAADGPIETENPGYASPAWHDVNGDGRADLVVGQFAGGKMAVYHGTEDGTLAARAWIMAGGEVAEVPGVW